MINPEWKRRIDRWMDLMPKLFYKPVGGIPFKGFVTKERIAPEEAARRKFGEMPVGTPWGGKWEYGWFKATVSIPKELSGKRIAIKVMSGGESVVFSNGSDLGGNSVAGWDHVNDIGGRLLTLASKAKGNETFELLVEGYAGHGKRECGGGPSAYGTEMVPKTPATQVVVGESSFGVWNEDIFQLWLDAETLRQLHDELGDKESLRAANIAQALQDMTLAVDFELPEEAMLRSVKEARKILKPALEAKNGSSAPSMACFGHSHIDVAWLWPLEETIRKCARTFGSQLELMKEYPEFKFLQSQPHTYWMVKENYPELYKRIKAAIKTGQWVPEGGMWVEPDTNITGGESLIRQFLHGKRFFKEEFGVDSKLMWLPDVFGYSGALPQIMNGCGITCFSTQKIFWTYNGGDPFPYNTFWWEGIDGSKVSAYIHNNYNSYTSPREIMSRWRERVQKDAFHRERLVPFGHGDGGGGPTREHLEFLRREHDLEGLPKCEMKHPLSFFDTLQMDKAPTWKGELYFQAHRGTYTTQARTKKGNRKSELALREAELWGSAAMTLAKFKFPLVKADSLWKLVLLNQFHDILPGSSIQRVYERAVEDLGKVMTGASEIESSAKRGLLKSDASSLTVFNSLSWERSELVELPKGVESLEGVPAQKSEGKAYALVEKLPSCGWKPFKKGKASALSTEKAVKIANGVIENEFIKLRLNASGEIVSMVDKGTGREFVESPCNKLRLFKDVPSWFDAWDIDSMYKSQEIELEGKVSVKVVAEGPLFATVRISRKLGDSEFTQDMTVRAGSRRVDFKTAVEWRESHKLLKVSFPVNVRNEDALQEIQFGHVKRPTHASKPYDFHRFEVCNHKWTALAEEGRGAAVLNDCKYGVSVEGSNIALTLLRSPLAPDMNADKGHQEFSYSFLVWDGPFKDSGLVREGYELNVPVSVAEGFAETRSLFTVDAPGVVIETVKPAEDGSGDIVVRLYESLRTATDCVLGLGFETKKAEIVNMLEETQGVLKLKSGKLALEFKPFEIKTLRFKV